MGFVLQADHIQRDLDAGVGTRLVALVDDREAARRQQPLGLQFLAAQAHDHHLAAEVRVQTDVAQRADRHRRVGRIDGHTAAVSMFERHHIVDVRESWQQFGLDSLHREVGDTCDALNRLRDGQDVACTDRAVGVAVALEAVAL